MTRNVSCFRLSYPPLMTMMVKKACCRCYRCRHSNYNDTGLSCRAVLIIKEKKSQKRIWWIFLLSVVFIILFLWAYVRSINRALINIPKTQSNRSNFQKQSKPTYFSINSKWIFPFSPNEKRIDFSLGKNFEIFHAAIAHCVTIHRLIDGVIHIWKNVETHLEVLEGFYQLN